MAYQSEAALEQQFIDQLNKQGYTSVSIPDYDALVENFKAQFETFNSSKLDRPLTDKEWERVMNIMLGKSVFQSAKILRDKFVLEREDGTKVYLSFFDADHTKNIFQATNQTTVVGKYVNRYDVTILVNGLPLIQVELKRRGIDIREAVNQVMRYKKHSYNGFYHFIQLFVVSNGVDTKYFANSDRDMLHSLAFFWTDFNNQFEIEGVGGQLRIPDGIVFVNGIPVVVLEFKSVVKENTTIMDAYTQLTVRYRRDIPELLKYNAFVVISDGVNNKYGSLFSPYGCGKGNVCLHEPQYRL